MKQQQQTGTGQSGKQPQQDRLASTIFSYRSTAMSCRPAGQIAADRKSLLGSCCCAGPVRDAQGRKYATFPYWVRGKTFLV